MKLIYINEFFNSFSGARIHSRKIVEELKKKDISIITFPKIIDEKKIKYKSKFKKRLNTYLPLLINDFIIFLKKTVRNIIWYFKIIRIIKKENPDCILIRPGLYDYLSVFLKKSIVKPIILEINAPLFYEMKAANEKRKSYLRLNKFIKKIEIKSWSFADAIYVVSNELKEFIFSVSHNKSLPVYVIYNGVDLTKFAAVKPDSNRIQDDCTDICFVGNLNKRYGIEKLINVFKEIVIIRPKIRLTIIGDGDSKDYFEMLIKYEDLLINKVIFTGKLIHQEVIKEMKNKDILVAPYLYTEFFYFSPIKIFEYMASGKAIVASKCGQINEILENRKNAILVEPGDHKELYEAILELIDNKELRTKFGENALCKVNQFTWEASAEKLLNVIKKVI